MGWINLLQDGAIVALSVSQIMQTRRWSKLRRENEQQEKRIDEYAEKEAKADQSLMHGEAVDNLLRIRKQYGFTRIPGFDGHLVRDPESCRTAHGFNPYLFHAGDSVQIDGVNGELCLTAYSTDQFTATATSDDQRVVSTATFSPDDVIAWKRNTGEWPVEWFTGDPDYANGSSNATVDAEPIAGTDATAEREEPRESDPQTVAAAGIHIVVNGSACSPSEGQCLGSYFHRGSK
ncbi:hypothetical protein [Bifidobacterium mongoliense]|uniref:hypothetical protein n=1 Tax=Bifidobacterium mongoliense TaxID=518643 RepID=UPI002649ECD6|nr:hypothetical protein [Bifidobacterium mongoliense]MDN5980007.1 hypothetical protein [Bifidobacterium mongoliense]